MKVRMNWGTGMALVYGSFATATVGFVVFAVSHPAALVSVDYYQQAMRHDARMEAAAEAASAGARLTIEGEPGQQVAVFRPGTLPAGPAVGTVTWYRPSDASLDRRIDLAIDADGLQRFDLSTWPTGRWWIKAEWTVTTRAFYFEQPAMIR